MQLLALLASVTAASAAAVKAPVSARQEDNIIYPARTYRHWVESGKLLEDPQNQPLVVKNGNQADETTTIVSFEFDESTKDKECKLLFELRDDGDTSTGTQQLDVFTYNNLPSDVKALAEILERDEHVGRIKALLGEEATWELSYDGWPTISCPAGETIGVEYVGVGDAVQVQWDIGVSGPRFEVLD